MRVERCATASHLLLDVRRFDGDLAYARSPSVKADRHATQCVLGPALPHREVVRERDAPRVELLEARHPRRVGRMRLSTLVEPPREERARVVGRLVEGLTRDDDASFLRVDDE